MRLRRIVKATSGTVDENLKHGYVVAVFDLDKGTWLTEWRGMKETKVRSGIGDTEKQTWEVVSDGQVRAISDAEAHNLIDQWDQIRKGGMTCGHIVGHTLKDFAGIAGTKKAVELAVRRKISRLTTGA